MTTVESLDQKIARIKAEQKSELTALLTQKAEIAAKLKELKVQEDAAKAEIKTAEAQAKATKLAEIIAKGGIEKKVNKSEVLLNMMLAGKDRAQMHEETGYTKKFIIDVVWRLEKQYGLR